MIRRQQTGGFTLLEILVVVAAISLLAGIVIVALNPNKQLAETRNAQRRVDVNTILNGIYQYAIDAGSLPSSITTTTTEICKTAATCTGLIDLSVLTNSGTYLVGMPVDPTGSSVNGAGYYVNKNTNGRVTVNAPSAEQGASITVTR
ncbi:MAG: prepilin-type N-terminal cleavage/methylation domain-containing protein [Patescibacteria group bacterium]